MTSRTGIALCSLAAVLWAASATVARDLIDSGASPLEMSELRAFIAALVFWLIARRHRQAALAWSVPAVALGVALAGVNLSYYMAIERLPVAIAVIIQYTAPALVVAWELLVNKHRPSAATLVALTGVLAGVTLVAEPFEALGAGSGLDPLGATFAALSAFGFAAYNLLAARTERIYGSIGAHARGFVIASVIWIIVQAPRGLPETVLHTSMIPGLLTVTVLGTVAAFGVYALGIKRIGATHATITSTVEPVAVALFAWIFLEQSLSPLQILGAAIILASVVSLRPRAPHALPEAPHPHITSSP